MVTKSPDWYLISIMVNVCNMIDGKNDMNFYLMQIFNHKGVYEINEKSIILSPQERLKINRRHWLETTSWFGTRLEIATKVLLFATINSQKI